MKVRSFLAVPAAIVALTVGTGCHNKVNAETGLSQAEAEQVSSNIYISNCHLPQPDLVRKVVLGKPDPNGHIREKYGSVMTYPVQVTWTGSCSGHPVSPQQTDFYENVNAKYTASYYKDQFGNWSHTPFVGTCSWVHAAYQPQGQPKTPVPNAQAEKCGISDTVND